MCRHQEEVDHPPYACFGAASVHTEPPGGDILKSYHIGDKRNDEKHDKYKE
jgi:hypothetical protein